MESVTASLFFVFVSIFIFGTLVGSFLNVVILRYNTGKKLSGRSRCQSCARVLSWSELIPLFSFLFLRGRCNTCGSAISYQYPLVEILTGVVFLSVFLQFQNILENIFALIIFSTLIVIVVYDMRHKIIPNGLVYFFIVVSFFYLFIDTQTLTLIIPNGKELLAGPIIATPLWALWALSSGRLMGLGDSKLILGVGWFLGLSKGVSVLILSFWLGALVSVILLFTNYVREKKSGISRITRLNLPSKKFTMKTEVPFAPFIVLSFYLVYVFDIDIIQLLIPQ